MKARALLMALALGATPVLAESIRIPLGAQGSAASTESLPQRGADEAEVLARFGEPAERHATVGEPPIERWDYTDFSVYFETGRVLHSVLRHRPAEPVN